MEEEQVLKKGSWAMAQVYHDGVSNTFKGQALQVKIVFPTDSKERGVLGFCPLASKDGSVDITGICERYRLEKNLRENLKIEVKVYGFKEVK